MFNISKLYGTRAPSVVPCRVPEVIESATKVAIFGDLGASIDSFRRNGVADGTPLLAAYQQWKLAITQELQGEVDRFVNGLPC
jgi:hypothetical protein